MSQVAKTYATVEDIVENTQKDKLEELLNNMSIDMFNVTPLNHQKVMRTMQANMPAGRPSREHMNKMESLSKLSRNPTIIAAMSRNKELLEHKQKYTEAIGSDPEANTLPATKKSDIMTNSLMNIEWTGVADLPSHSDEAIRAMGSEVFRAFSNEGNDEAADSFATADLICMSTLAGNDEVEMNSTLHWIRAMGSPKKGFSDIPAEIDMTQVIDGYKPEVLYYEVGNMDFKIVKDFAGTYIYGWENDNLGRKLKNELKPKKLSNDNDKDNDRVSTSSMPKEVSEKDKIKQARHRRRNP